MVSSSEGGATVRRRVWAVRLAVRRTKTRPRSAARLIMRGLWPEVMAARRARFFDRDAMQDRDERGEAVPEPHGDHLRRRIVEAGDVVEAVVVELRSEERRVGKE